MKNWAIIIGALFLFAMSVATWGQDCPDFDDPNVVINPNGYPDEPNTLENGLFECGDPNRMTPYGTLYTSLDGTSYDFVPPIYWQRIPHEDSTILNTAEPNKIDCYAGLLDSFDPHPGESDWIIQQPYQGNAFVLLSTGGLVSEIIEPRTIQSGQISGSSISQQIFIEPGDMIFGAYFFGTKDYLPYNDYGQIRLELIDPNIYETSVPSIIITETYCDVSIVGDKQATANRPDVLPGTSTSGWVPFTHTFSEPNEYGLYSLICEVVDVQDVFYDSYYAVDDLRICKGGIPQADLDSDCDVDLVDYSILSEAWLCFCPDDPNFYEPNLYDPNLYDPHFFDPNLFDPIFDPNIFDPNFYDPNTYPPPVADSNSPCQLADIDNSWFVDPNDMAILTDEWLINNLE